MNFFCLLRVFTPAVFLLLTSLQTFASDGIATPLAASVGQTVRLDPTDGFDAEIGQPLRAEWSWIARPATSVADFDAPDILRPSFTLDAAGTYVALLSLFDTTDPAATVPLHTTRIEVSTDNLTPVARIVGRGMTHGSTPLTLDATPSFDVDGDALRYAWTIENAPVGSLAAISDSTNPITSVSLDLEGLYQVGLTVQDSTGAVSERATYEVQFLPFSGSTDVYRLSYDTTLSANPSAVDLFNLGDRSGADSDHVLISSFTLDDGATAFADSLTLTYEGISYTLTTAQDFLAFVDVLELDLNGDTNVRISPNAAFSDLTFVFGPSNGSLTIQNIFSAELTREALLAHAVDYYEGVGGRQTAPVATLRFDQVPAGLARTISLEPYASTDIDGSVLLSEVDMAFGPAGAAPVVSTDIDGVFAITPDSAGDYLVSLKVNDGMWNAFDQVLVVAGPTATVRPVARIAPVGNPVAGSALSLDGTQSYDLDGDLLSYQWALLSSPAGSAVSLEGATASIAALTPDQPGLYVVQLQVFDGTKASVPVTYAVVAGAPLPVAEAGPDMLSGELGQVTLDGTLSAGGALSYDWAAIGLTGDGSSGTFDDATLAMPFLSLEARTGRFSDVIKASPVYHFKRDDTGGLCRFDIRMPADVVGADPGEPVFLTLHSRGRQSVKGQSTYVWEIENKNNATRLIRLEDDGGMVLGEYTLPGRVSIHVTTPDIGKAELRVFVGADIQSSAGAKKHPFNRNNPVCTGPGAGVVQLIVADENGISTPDTTFIGNANLRPVLSRTAKTELVSGQVVTFAGADYAYDANGDVLSYSWSLLTRPVGSVATISADPLVRVLGADTLSFAPDRVGTYLVQLVANDGALFAEPVVFEVEVINSAPVAVASVTSPVFVGEVATLDGSGSFDPDGDALGYNWVVSSRPEGSTASIPDPFGPLASFVPDVRGTYSFELVVSDYEFTSAPAPITLVVPNRAPVAQLTGPAEIKVGAEIIYSAAGSTDPDNDTLSYSYAVVAAPAGDAPVVVDLGAGEVGFVAVTAGSYTLQVSVSDGIAQSVASINIAASAANSAPVLSTLRDTYTVELGLELALDLSATDPDGDPVTYYASPLPLPAGMVLDATSGELRFRPEAGQEGIYNITLGVSEGVLTDSQAIAIQVVPATAGDTAITGRILDAVDFANGIETPLAAIPVRLADAALMTTTAADGTFRFGSLSGGADLLMVQPALDNGPGGYAELTRTVQITDNQIRDIAPDILLTPLNDGCASPVAGLETVLAGATSGVTVKIAADSIRDGAGNAYTGQVCLGTLPQLFEQSGLPNGTKACNIYALEAPGAVFTQGIQITAPNNDLLPVGAIPELMYLNKVTSLFRPTANGVVDPGGATLSGSSADITASTMFTFLPQAPEAVASADMPTGNKSLSLFEGDLSETYTLPGYTAFNRTQQIGLAYHSSAADPTLIIAGDVTIPDTASLPVSLQTRVDIGGLNVEDTRSWTPRIAADGTSPNIVGEAVTMRQSTPVDATGLPSGRYAYRYQSAASYACSTVTAAYEGEAYVQNETTSPYGRGWSVDGLQKLVVQPDGKVAIIDDDSIATFDPKPTLTEFDGAPLVFPTSGTVGLTTGDFDNNGELDIAYGEGGTGDIKTLLNFGNRDIRTGTSTNVATPVTVPATGFYVPSLTAIDAGDVNADGYADIAYTAQLDNGIRGYLKGKADLGFETGFRKAGNVWFDVDILQFDGSQGQDIVFAGTRPSFIPRNIFDIYYGQDAGGFSNSLIGVSVFGPTLQLLIGDLEGDGDNDIAYRRETGIDLFIKEPTKFQYSLPKLGDNGAPLLGKYAQQADFNGDNKLDFVWSSQTDLRVFLNTTGRAWDTSLVLPRPTSASSAAPVAVIDANGDGELDILLSTGQEIAVYYGNGDGTFQPFETGLVNYSIDDLEIADVNGDGSLDLISMDRFNVRVHFSKPSASGQLISGDGEFSTLTKLPDGTWQRRYKDGNIVEFDADGRQTAEVDTHGNRRTFVYDADGRLATITDQVGGITSFAYQPDGRLASIAYPDGRTTQFTYDDTAALVSVTEADLGNIRYRYDAQGRLVAVSDQRGNTTEHSYTSIGTYAGSLYPNGSSIANAAGSALGISDLGAPQPLAYVAPEDRISYHTDEKGGVTAIEVNAFGAIVATLDPIGRYAIYERNEDNLVTRVIRPTENHPTQTVPASGEILEFPQRVDEMDYDARGNMIALRMAVGTELERQRSYEYEPIFNRLVKFTDVDGFMTSYEYDAFGDLTKTTDAEGNIRSYAYNIYGLIDTETDERGNQTNYDYDLRANINLVRLPDGTENLAEYDDRGNVIRLTEAFQTAQSRTTVRDFDIEGRVISEDVLDAAGLSIDGKVYYEYDIAGNITAIQDETGLRTEYNYDNMNQLISDVSPAYGATTYTYNGAGEVIKETDAEGFAASWDYDAVGRMTRMVDGVGNISTFSHDVSDNLIEVVDGRLNKTIFGYDIFERPVNRTNPINQTIFMAYDKRDNLVKITRENGAIETASYDGLSRRTRVETPDNILTYSYDPVGNLLTAGDNDSLISISYDNRDRLASVTTGGVAGPQPAVTLNYTYDALNQRKTLTDSLGITGGTWSYGFDPKSRVSRIIAPWGDTHTMDYDPAGRRTALANQTGRQTTINYASDRLTQLEHFQNGTSVARSGYAYAADGAITLLRDLDDSTLSRTLNYDGINRLTMVSEGTPTADGGIPIPVEDYAYDATGNRTTSHLSSTYTVDNHNRLLADDLYEYAYDTKGNRISRTLKADPTQVETYSYDSLNQLIGYTGNGVTATYAHDAFGRRIVKTVNGATTAYVYDMGALGDVTTHDRLLEFEDGVLTKRWLHGQQIDEPVAYEAYGADTAPGAGTVYALHADRQGSVIAVTDQATGTIAARYVYDAFGRREQTVALTSVDIGFTGREYDAESGLYHYRARAYDPNVGRFLQSDPLGFAAGDLNLYAYTWNDPANWTDPSGLSATAEDGKLSARLAGLARASSRRVGRGARCIGNRVGTFLSGVGRLLRQGRDLSQIRVSGGPNCRTRVAAPKCSCKDRAGGLAGGGFLLSSFPEGTEVLTPDGKVAIETLREGDLVVARNDETGVSGVFPVTAVMGRTAPEVLWLTLENTAGETTRMGVTAEHPLFTVGQGWITAGELAPGDAIRDKDLLPLTVLVVEADDTPQHVHNLEIAEAHTYFAGELEAWGHNAKSSTSGNNSAAAYGKQQHKCYRRNLPRIRLPSGKVVDAFDRVARKVYELKPDTPAQKRRGQRQVDDYACELSELFGEEIEGVVETYPPFKR